MVKTINFSDVNPITKKESFEIKKEIYSVIEKEDFILGNSVKNFELSFSKLSKI